MRSSAGDSHWGKGSELPSALGDRGGIGAAGGKSSSMPNKPRKLTLFEHAPVKTSSHFLPVVVVIICCCVFFSPDDFAEEEEVQSFGYKRFGK